jgi:hypothetical protein
MAITARIHRPRRAAAAHSVTAGRANSTYRGSHSGPARKDAPISASGGTTASTASSRSNARSGHRAARARPVTSSPADAAPKNASGRDRTRSQGVSGRQVKSAVCCRTPREINGAGGTSASTVTGNHQKSARSRLSRHRDHTVKVCPASTSSAAGCASPASATDVPYPSQRAQPGSSSTR